mgnify:CR=1 FL=1
MIKEYRKIEALDIWILKLEIKYVVSSLWYAWIIQGS